MRRSTASFAGFRRPMRSGGMASIHIVNAGYRSTNYWLLSAGRRRLLVDLGWPGMAGVLVANLDRLGVPITACGNIVVPLAESRAFLSRLGFSGELVHTPGHSEDSVSLVLDSGEAFTGDLTWPEFATEETADVVAASWVALAKRGAERIYGGHGPVRPLPAGF
jgi:glyoxylase-like metal-dependent hydrolase (beta-lactamase superfamily II)